MSEATMDFERLFGLNDDDSDTHDGSDEGEHERGAGELEDLLGLDAPRRRTTSSSKPEAEEDAPREVSQRPESVEAMLGLGRTRTRSGEAATSSGMRSSSKDASVERMLGLPQARRAAPGSLFAPEEEGFQLVGQQGTVRRFVPPQGEQQTLADRRPDRAAAEAIAQRDRLKRPTTTATGPMFDTSGRPKTYDIAHEQLRRQLVERGWSLSDNHGFVIRPDNALRLDLRPQSVYLQLRDGSRWATGTRSLGDLKDVVAQLDHVLARLEAEVPVIERSSPFEVERVYETTSGDATGRIQYALRPDGQWFRRFQEKHPRFGHRWGAWAKAPFPHSDADRLRLTSGKARLPLEDAEPKPAKPVIVRYTLDEGLLLAGATKPNKDAIKALREPFRFRFSRGLPNDATWYAQRTIGVPLSRETVDAVAAGLRTTGVPVVVEYEAPKPEEPSSGLTSGISSGPIDDARVSAMWTAKRAMQRTMRQLVDGENGGAIVDQSTSPIWAHLQKIMKEEPSRYSELLRGALFDLATLARQFAADFPRAAGPAFLAIAEWLAVRAHADWRPSADDLRTPEHRRPFWISPEASDAESGGVGELDRMITAAMNAPRPFGPSSPATEAAASPPAGGRLSATQLEDLVTVARWLPNQPVPDRAALDTAMIQAFALAGAPGTRELRVALRKRAPTKHHKEVASESAAKAVALDALARGHWPPAPERGDTYHEREYFGVLDALEADPVIAKARAMGSTFRRQLSEVITHSDAAAKIGTPDGGGVWSTWRLPDSDVGDWFNAIRGPNWIKGQSPASAVEVRDYLQGLAERFTGNMAILLDPKLWDYQHTSPEYVAEQLCKVGSEWAHQVLATLYRVPFGWARKGRDQASALCDGKESIDGLRRAHAHEELERAEREHANEQRHADLASRILAVFADASHDGSRELNRTRLNNALRRAGLGSEPGFSIDHYGPKLRLEHDGEAYVYANPPNWERSKGTHESYVDLRDHIASLAAGEQSSKAAAELEQRSRALGELRSKVDKLSQGDLERIAKAHGITRGGSIGRRGDLHDAIREAYELAGVAGGAAMRAYLGKLGLSNSVYSIADGTRWLAETNARAWYRDGRPGVPPPLNGREYSKEETIGVTHDAATALPLVVEAIEKAKQLDELAGSNPLVAEAIRGDTHFLKLSGVPSVAHHVKARLTYERQMPESMRRKTVEDTRKALEEFRERLDGSARWYIRALDIALDPALYEQLDSDEQINELVDRLCRAEIADRNFIAGILRAVHGVELDRDQEPCTPLPAPRRGIDVADVKAERERERQEEADRKHQSEANEIADARDLLRIFEASTDETVAAFNRAYKKLFPDAFARKGAGRHRMHGYHWPGFSRQDGIDSRYPSGITVVGPRGSMFQTEEYEEVRDPQTGKRTHTRIVGRSEQDLYGLIRAVVEAAVPTSSEDDQALAAVPSSPVEGTPEISIPSTNDLRIVAQPFGTVDEDYTRDLLDHEPGSIGVVLNPIGRQRAEYFETEDGETDYGAWTRAYVEPLEAKLLEAFRHAGIDVSLDFSEKGYVTIRAETKAERASSVTHADIDTGTAVDHGAPVATLGAGPWRVDIVAVAPVPLVNVFSGDRRLAERVDAREIRRVILEGDASARGPASLLSTWAATRAEWERITDSATRGAGLTRYLQDKAESARQRWEEAESKAARLRSRTVATPKPTSRESTTTTAENLSDASAVIIRVSPSEGVLLAGDTKAHKDAIKALRSPYRFRYSRALPGGAAWFAVRTRNTAQPRAQVEALADALRRAGVPVRIESEGEPSSSSEGQPSHAVSSEEPPAVEGSAEQAPAVEPSRERAPDRAKLRALADDLEVAANEELSRDRLENTRRRAAQADTIRARARRQLVLAQTLRRIADAVSSHESYTYVSKVSGRLDVEALEKALEQGSYERRLAAGVSEPWERTEPEAADPELATYRPPSTSAGHLRDLLEVTKGRAAARRVLERAVKRFEAGNNWGELGPAELEAVRELLSTLRKSSKSIPYQVKLLAEELREHDRLTRLGIVDTPTLRAALREYFDCCRGATKTQAADPTAARKRDLKFANIPGYFPTPRKLAEELVALANLHAGQRVLEPSAGSGGIAEVIRERHPKVELEVVERNHTLRELLTEGGFHLVGDDFTTFESPHPYGYERIIMNPPFEERQDAEHIGRALELLPPGGRLVAIASGSFLTRNDAATKRVRDRILELGGDIEPLPQGSFKSSGTDANAVRIVVEAPFSMRGRDAIDQQILSEIDTERYNVLPAEIERLDKRARRLEKARKYSEAETAWVQLRDAKNRQETLHAATVWLRGEQWPDDDSSLARYMPDGRALVESMRRRMAGSSDAPVPPMGAPEAKPETAAATDESRKNNQDQRIAKAERAYFDLWDDDPDAASEFEATALRGDLGPLPPPAQAVADRRGRKTAAYWKWLTALAKKGSDTAVSPEVSSACETPACSGRETERATELEAAERKAHAKQEIERGRIIALTDSSPNVSIPWFDWGSGALLRTYRGNKGEAEALAELRELVASNSTAARNALLRIGEDVVPPSDGTAIDVRDVDPETVRKFVAVLATAQGERPRPESGRVRLGFVVLATPHTAALIGRDPQLQTVPGAEWTAAEGSDLDHDTRGWSRFGWETVNMSPGHAEFRRGPQRIEIWANTVYPEHGRFEVRVDGFPWRDRFYPSPASALESLADYVVAPVPDATKEDATATSVPPVGATDLGSSPPVENEPAKTEPAHLTVGPFELRGRSILAQVTPAAGGRGGYTVRLVENGKLRPGSYRDFNGVAQALGLASPDAQGEAERAQIKTVASSITSAAVNMLAERDATATEPRDATSSCATPACSGRKPKRAAEQRKAERAAELERRKAERVRQQAERQQLAEQRKAERAAELERRKSERAAELERRKTERAAERLQRKTAKESKRPAEKIKRPTQLYARRVWYDNVTGDVAPPRAAGATASEQLFYRARPSRGPIVYVPVDQEDLDPVFSLHAIDTDHTDLYRRRAEQAQHDLTHLAAPLLPDTPIPWARLGIPETFPSVEAAISTLEDLNEELFQQRDEPIDALRDWAKSYDIEGGRRWKKASGTDKLVFNRRRKVTSLYKSPRGQQIFEEGTTAARSGGHAETVFRRLLAYLLGKADGRRWDRVPWFEVERLLEAWSGSDVSLVAPLSSGLYTADEIFGRLEGSSIGVDRRTLEELSRRINGAALYRFAERLDELLHPQEGPTKRALQALSKDVRATLRRRLATLYRWSANPELIPDYTCAADVRGTGWLCTFGAIARDINSLATALRSDPRTYAVAVPQALANSEIPVRDYAPLAEDAIPF